MPKTMMMSALSLAIVAPSLVCAQTPAVPAPLKQTASLLSFPLAWTSLPTLRSSSFAAESLPDAPIPSAEFASILYTPCITHTAADGTVMPDSAEVANQPCLQTSNAYARFLDSAVAAPLTPAQKAHLAIRDLIDPGNLVTITDIAAFTVATNPHTADGPGWSGFVRDAGYTFSQDATGEFFGTFLIPSLIHQDPRYHRMPNASIPRRIVNAISHTVISQSDTGARMPNVTTLLTYPAVAEISNLYVPGINGNGPSTVDRILTGYATDPADNLITEFLPDVARHIHIHIVFVQSILNQISTGQVGMAPSVVQ